MSINNDCLLAGFVTSINGHSIDIAWTRIFQVTWFFGYFSAALLYYVLNKALPPKGLGIQEDIPEYIDGVETVDEVTGTVIEVPDQKSKHTVQVGTSDQGRFDVV